MTGRGGQKTHTLKKKRGSEGYYLSENVKGGEGRGVRRCVHAKKHKHAKKRGGVRLQGKERGKVEL